MLIINTPFGAQVGSDFFKQGSDSAGVQRQWCGELGKVDNCQAGVFLGYASRKGWIGACICLRRWFGEDYQEKRQKCGIPEEVVFKSKTELAVEKVAEQAQLGVLPYQWLCFNEFFNVCRF